MGGSMKKLSNQLFQNAESLAAQGRQLRQSVIDPLDKILINLCSPDGTVPPHTSDTVGVLSKVIAFLEDIYLGEPCYGFTVKPLEPGQNVHAWIANRKALIKADTEAFLILGHTVGHLYRLLKNAIPDEFKSVLDKEYEQDVSDKIDRERMRENRKRLCSIQ